MFTDVYRYHPDDGGSNYLRNVGKLIPYFTTASKKTATFIIAAMRS
jgi:hypothetical protein